MDNPIRSARKLLDSPVREAARRIESGRQRYLEGAPAGTDVRPVIAASWERTRALGIDPTAARAPIGIEPETIDEILRTRELGMSGRQVLDRFAGLVDGSRHVIVLADEQGRIIYGVGNGGVQDELEAINFVPGGLWNEAAVGPNGVGTPLELGHPEVVFGAEHFCEGWQPWVCYGAPVIDPDSGRPLGVIDITGPSGAADLQTLALTISIAQSVEQQLSLSLLRNRDQLRSGFREMEKRWPGDALVLLSDSGRIVEINRIAASALDLGEVVFADRLLSEVQPDLWMLVRDLVQTGRYGERRGEVAVGVGGASKQLECRVQPVHLDHRKIGAVLVVSGFHPLFSARRASAPAPRRTGLDAVLGSSEAVARVRELAALAASDDGSTVLLVGETGTGKELFARGIHEAGPRAGKAFVAVNCGALPRDLAESELFGYAPGSFTGASRGGRIGKFEAADGGTLFLDEVDSLPLELQAKLLRVLEDLHVTRIGEHEARAVDVRVIAAAGTALRQRIADGAFRADLFHRLNVIDIALPPLRERHEDVAELALDFVTAECRRRGIPVPDFDPPLLDALAAYDWPGNVRELQNVCRRMLLLSRGSTMTLADLPETLQPAEAPVDGGPRVIIAGAQSLRSIGDDAIRQALDEAGGNVAEASRRLGIARTTIYRRQRRWQSRG